MEPKKQAIVLGLAWFVVGALIYAAVAGLSLLGSMGGITTPPPAFQAVLGFILCGLPFPLLFGWVPAAYRLVKGKKGPWISAGIMGAIAIILPIVSFIALVNSR